METRDNVFCVSRNGEIERAKRMVLNGADVNHGLFGACEGGHLEIVKWMLANGATDIGKLYGIYSACQYNQIETSKLMLTTDVDVKLCDAKLCGGLADWGFEGACRGANHELAKLMFLQNPKRDINTCLAGACSSGDIEMAEWMIREGATEFNYGLFRACKHGHVKTAELMIQKGAFANESRLLEAEKNGHKEVVSLLKKHGARLPTEFKKMVYTTLMQLKLLKLEFILIISMICGLIYVMNLPLITWVLIVCVLKLWSIGFYNN